MNVVSKLLLIALSRIETLLKIVLLDLTVRF